VENIQKQSNGSQKRLKLVSNGPKVVNIIEKWSNLFKSGKKA
jgi:hypothetical protein